MQPENLGRYLRHWREKANLGPIKVACKSLGISHSTLGMYETGKLLPDVDFLAVFTDRTGADFNELLRLRLLSGKTSEARRIGAVWSPPMDADQLKDAQEIAQTLSDKLDELVEEAEIQYEGEDTFAFLDEEEKQDFINEIIGILTHHKTTAPQDAPPVERHSESRQVDPRLMAQIAAKLEIKFLTSNAAAVAFHKFMVENRRHIQRLAKTLLEDHLTPDKIPVEPILESITRYWVRYAGTEAAAAAYIYNRVSQTPEDKQESLIEEEIAFFHGFRAMDLRDYLSESNPERPKN